MLLQLPVTTGQWNTSMAQSIAATSTSTQLLSLSCGSTHLLPLLPPVPLHPAVAAMWHHPAPAEAGLDWQKPVLLLGLV
jgi:hypothetical protein